MTFDEVREVFDMYKSSIESKTGQAYTKHSIDPSMSSDTLLNILIEIEADSKAA